VSVLLTGATGFVGMEVLARLLERGDDVVVLVRGDAGRRTQEVLRTLGDRHAPARVRAIAGDLAEPGLSVPGDVTEIVHCAASISFSLPLDEARRINVDGTRRVLDAAHRLPRLRRLVHVSTAYVAGRHRGRFAARDLDVGQSFRNSYERSKHEAESLLREEADGLPLAVARPSIVVGESDTGWTPAFNVLYWPLRAFDRGLLDRVPAARDGRVDVVPVDFVADALVALLDGDATGTVHLVAGDAAPTNAQLVELACRALDRPPPVLDAAAGLDLDHGDVYVPYFDVETVFDQHPDLAPPALETYFDRIVDYARRARWGKRPLSRREARAGAPASGVTA
jgi:nucleoside-diphosphate-sugar epimerase